MLTTSIPPITRAIPLMRGQVALAHEEHAHNQHPANDQGIPLDGPRLHLIAQSQVVPLDIAWFRSAHATHLPKKAT